MRRRGCVCSRATRFVLSILLSGQPFVYSAQVCRLIPTRPVLQLPRARVFVQRRADVNKAKTAFPLFRIRRLTPNLGIVRAIFLAGDVASFKIQLLNKSYVRVNCCEKYTKH